MQLDSRFRNADCGGNLLVYLAADYVLHYLLFAYSEGCIPLPQFRRLVLSLSHLSAPIDRLPHGVEQILVPKRTAS